MKKPNLYKDLEKMLDAVMQEVAIPRVNDNEITVGNYVVYKNQDRFSVRTKDRKKNLGTYYFKLSALAVARQLSLGRNVRNRVKDLDYNLNKHYNDSLFFKANLESHSSKETRNTCEFRYEISKKIVEDSISKLDRYVFHW